MATDPVQESAARDGNAAPRAPGAIELGFQLRFIAKTGALMAAGAFVPVGILWIVTSRFAANTYFEIFRDLSDLHIKLLWVSVFSAAGQFLLVGLVASAIALFASHRVAGPLIRLEHALRELASGNLAVKLQFRRGDQDKSLPIAFHSACRTLHRRIEIARNTAAELRTLAAELRNRTVSSVSAEEAGQIMARIRTHADRLQHGGQRHE